MESGVAEPVWPLAEVDLSLAELKSVQVKQLLECGYDLDEAQVLSPKDDSDILIDTATSAIRQCKLLGITMLVNADAAYFPVQVPLSSDRWQWLNDVREEKDLAGISSANVELKLKEKGRRGLTVQEGLALYRSNPSLLKTNSLLVLIGAHYYRSKPLGERGAIRMFPALDRNSFDNHPQLTTRPANASSSNGVFFSVPLSYGILGRQ